MKKFQYNSNEFVGILDTKTYLSVFDCSTLEDEEVEEIEDVLSLEVGEKIVGYQEDGISVEFEILRVE